ncbi:hypothetical protein JNJ66_01485 [Candidatus Saccharibacteria bacterium]|nr:hypothetical protein [Candidatus Saccharibacteria bacterium]
MLFFLQVISIIFLIALGLAVLLRNPTAPSRRALLAFLVSISLWIMAGILGEMDALGMSLLWSRLAFVFPVAAVYSCYVLVVKMIHGTLYAREHRFYLRTLALICLGVMLYALIGNGVVADIQLRQGLAGNIGYDVVRGPGYIAYMAILVAVGILSLSVMVNTARHIKGQIGQQLLIMFYGLLLTLAVGLVVGSVLPSLIGNSEPAGYAFLAGYISVAAFTYVILKHKLFDLRLVVARSVAYVFVLLTFAVLYGLATFGIIQYFFKDERVSLLQNAVYIGLAIALAVTYGPLKRFFDKVTDKLFFRHDYNMPDIISRLGDVAINETAIDTLALRARVILMEAIRPERMSFLIMRPGESTPRLLAAEGGMQLPFMPKLVSQLERHTKSGAQRSSMALSREELPATSELRRLMSKLDIDVVVALKATNDLKGYILSGLKQNGSIYTQKDMQLLSTAADELALGFQNAMRFEEIRQFNVTLQQKVDEATARLRRSNAKLRQLDEAKDEFVSMASHQLRTPLTSVKGYLSLVLEGDAGPINETQHKMLTEAFNSSQRMVYLIADFLNVSRLKTGKFMLEYGEVDMAAVVAQEIQQLRTVAQGRGLKLQYEPPAHIPRLRLDETKMRQVIMNLTDNAIYYSRPGTTVTVELYVRSGQLVFKVKDKGIGVPVAEQHDLFEKFFRASNARKTRPDGTGIGLYMIKKVVTAHGGSIIFSSVEGKGSTFGFSLPLPVKPDTSTK